MNLTVSRTPKMDGFEFRFIVSDFDFVRIGPATARGPVLLAADNSQELVACLRGLLVIAEDLQQRETDDQDDPPTAHLNLSIRETKHGHLD